MKSLVNPLLLVLCILLLVFGIGSFLEGVAQGELPADKGMSCADWVIYLCIMAVIVNGALGLARALAHRPSLLNIAWAVVFLIFGCCVWTLSQNEEQSLAEREAVQLQERLDAWQGGQLSPFAVDDHGDCVLTLAAGLGREDIIADVLADAGANGYHQDALVRAAHRAAERNREQVLLQLHAAGVSPDARLQDVTLLHAAALHKARRAAACLLELGASPNATMAEGSTPLHHAVLAEDEAMVQLLLQHGADPALTDADGRDAASYARSESIVNALTPPAAPAAAEDAAP